MAKKVVVEVDVKTSQAQKEVKDLNNSINDTSGSINEVSNAADKFSGGAVSAFKGVIGSVKTAITGFKSLKVAIIGTGIGALVLAVVSLGQAFTRSEEGQNKFAKILGVIGSVTGNLLDLLANLGEKIIGAFENPKQALINFKNLLVENITNRFKAILDTVGFLGSAIKNVFSGDFKKALEDAKKAGSSFVDSFTGVENSIGKATNAVKEFSKEIIKDAKSAANIADMRANAEKKARDLIIERAEAERKIAELREKAVNKDKFTAEERIKFLEEAGKISDNLASKEIEVANLRFNAKKAENALTKSNKADLEEEANLQAEAIQRETERLQLQKRLSTELLTSRRELAAEAKAEEDKKKAEQATADAEELKRLQELEKTKLAIRDAVAITEDEKNNLEIQKTVEKYNALIEAAKNYGLDTLALEEAQRLALQELEDRYNAEKLEKGKKISEQERELELQKIKDKQMVVDAISQFADAESDTAKALLIIKQALALKETLMDIKRITFKGSQAIGEAGVATAQNVAESSKIGFPQNIITIASAIAQGISIIRSVKKAVSKTKAQAGAVSGGGGGGISAPSVPSAPPSFNIVGSSDTNQLAEAIGSQEQKPVKAYVTSNDVTTAQGLDRNIVEGASIG